MDVFVKSYIPLWLTTVNTLTENVQRSALPNDGKDSRQAYIASFSGTDVWRSDAAEVSSLDNDTTVGTSSENLTKGHLKRLEACLLLEQRANHERAFTWNRYQVRLSPYSQFPNDRSRSADFMLYECTVPGIQDFNPPVFLNDVVELRQLIPEFASFDGIVYKASVFGVRRAKGIVILRTPRLSLHSGLFNLVFLHDDRHARDQLAMLRSLSSADSEPSCQHYLFPEIGSCKIKTQLTEMRQFDWKDESLNFEQKKTVQEIVEHKYGQLPYLIQGPPGTGKTKTVVETIMQILLLDPNARIIACGPSNTSADTIALRLVQYLHTPNVLLRLNAASRSFEEVPEPLLPFSSIENDTFCMPKFSKLMMYRVIVGTIAEVSELTHVRCNNKSLAQFQQYTLQSVRPTLESSPHFTHLFLDEAGQATEPESICAMQVITSSDPGFNQRISIVLAGDHRQLGPRILSEEARTNGLDISFFERLMTTQPCYTTHPLSRSILQKHPRPKLPYPHAPFSNLYRNYRSHEAILMIPSQLSYNSSLTACASNVHRISSAITDSIPVSFIGHNGSEDASDAMTDVVTSWYNQTEINLILHQVKSLVGQHNEQCTISPEEIAVLTPFREQVIRVRLALRKAGFHAVRVGTVEDYQGAESRIVIISIVRTQERFLQTDCAHSLGLIHEKRRTNVALTRARELLVVIGHPSLMIKDDSWRSWLAFCERHHTYTGYKIANNGSSNPTSMVETPLISSLEMAYTFRDTNRPSLGSNHLDPDAYSDEAMILAGHAAQVALEEID